MQPHLMLSVGWSYAWYLLDVGTGGEELEEPAAAGGASPGSYSLNSC
ncbi:MAG: hypothetical protein QW230_05390 [Thermofilum sp.]